MKQELIQLVKTLVGHEYLYFDSAVYGSVWAVCVSPKDEIYVMDAEEQWHPVDDMEPLDEILIERLHERVKEDALKYVAVTITTGMRKAKEERRRRRLEGGTL